MKNLIKCFEISAVIAACNATRILDSSDMNSTDELMDNNLEWTGDE